MHSVIFRFQNAQFESAAWTQFTLGLGFLKPLHLLLAAFAFFCDIFKNVLDALFKVLGLLVIMVSHPDYPVFQA